MIGQNALIQILSTVLSAVITFFTLSFSARIFGPEILGNLAYLLSLTGLIFAFSDLGFSRAHIHYTAHSKNLGNNLGTFLTIKSILFLTSSFLAVGYYLLSNAPSYWLLFSLIIVYEVLTRLSDSILITFEALQQSLPQNLIKLIAKLFRLTAILFMAKILVSDLGFSLTYLVEAVALIILSLWLLTRFKPLGFNQPLANKYLLYSLPFFAIIPLSYLQTNSLVLILRKFQPASEVGYYSAANQLVGFIKTLYAAVMIYFFPKISQFHQQNNSLAIKDYVQSAFRYLLTWFTPVFMLLYWFRQEVVLLILGPDFLPAVPVFSVFLLGIYLLMIIAPFDQVLFATKN
ncbi:oligosaccharide flippase family protein, partial [Patescibacteria group bacterium]|nr:oligosaccharide flippase family protein [Patescibacteria group bacterium]